MKKQFFFTLFFSNNSGMLLASVPQADTDSRFYGAFHSLLQDQGWDQ